MRLDLHSLRQRARGWLTQLEVLPGRHWLFVLIAAVAIPRLIWIASMPTIPFTDMAMYDTFAMRIARGYGYTQSDGTPTAFWPAGYSFFLAGTYRLFGHHHLPVKLIQVGLALATCWGIYALALPFSKRVARPAALVVALWPSLIGMVDILASENLFLPLFAGAALLFGRMALARPHSCPIFAGVMLGAAVLVRPLGAGVAACALAFWACQRSRARWAGWYIALAVAMAVLVVSPWTVRNFLVWRSFVPVSTNLGEMLWTGNHHGATGTFIEPSAFRAIKRTMTEPQRDWFFRRLALDFVRRNPGEAALLIPKKAWSFIERDTVTVGWMHFDSLAAPRPLWLKWVLAGWAEAYYAIALLLAAYGLAAGALRRPDGRWILLLCSYYFAVHLVLLGDPRYHLPVLPLVAVLTAFGAVSRIDGKSREPATTGFPQHAPASHAAV